MITVPDLNAAVGATARAADAEARARVAGVLASKVDTTIAAGASKVATAAGAAQAAHPCASNVRPNCANPSWKPAISSPG